MPPLRIRPTPQTVVWPYGSLPVALSRVGGLGSDGSTLCFEIGFEVKFSVGTTHRRQLHIVRNGLTSCRTSKSEDNDTDRANAALGFQSVKCGGLVGCVGETLDA